MARLIIQGWQPGTVIAVYGWTGTPSGPAPVPAEGCVADLLDDEVLAATVISLFCDKRLSFDGPEPLTPDDRRGWWGDRTLDANDRIGSYLWRLARWPMVDTKIFPEILFYCQDALKWMVDDGVAKDIKFDISKVDRWTVGIKVLIEKPEAKKLTQYYFTWKLTAQGV